MHSTPQAERRRYGFTTHSQVQFRFPISLERLCTFCHAIPGVDPQPHTFLEKTPLCLVQPPNSAYQNPGGTLASSSLDSILTKIGGRGVPPPRPNLCSTCVSRLCHTHSECDTLYSAWPLTRTFS